jgi:DNA polymerase III delta prime subunit
MAKLAMQFMKRVGVILETEGVEYDKAVVAEIIQKYFPDWRRVLNELQRYSATGKIDSGILANMQSVSIKGLTDLMKDKNYSGMRNWVNTNIDSDINDLYRQFYDSAVELMDQNSVPMLVLAIAKYQYQAAFAADPEINFMAFLTEIMIDCSFK